MTIISQIIPQKKGRKPLPPTFLTYTRLGSRFLEEAERCLSTIVEYPESAPVLQGDIRRQLMRSFPYGLLYTIKPDFIRVLAVMNLHRRPLYWIGRD